MLQEPDMKNFAHYLAESERTYNYRIKLLGKPPGDLVSQLKKKLDQFDPVKMSDPKTTPIQIVPTDFPNNSNAFSLPDSVLNSLACSSSLALM